MIAKWVIEITAFYQKNFTSSFASSIYLLIDDKAQAFIKIFQPIYFQLEILTFSITIYPLFSWKLRHRIE